MKLHCLLLAGIFLASLFLGCGTAQDRYGEYVPLPSVKGITVNTSASQITTCTVPENPTYVDIEVSYIDSLNIVRHMSENDLGTETDDDERIIVWEVTYSGQGLRPDVLYTAVVSTGARYRHYTDEDSYYMELKETFRTFEFKNGQILSSRTEMRSSTITEQEIRMLSGTKSFQGEDKVIIIPPVQQ